MSIKKYDIAKDFKQGVVDRIKSVPCNDWDSKSSHYMAGYTMAGAMLYNIIHDELNKYLKSLGEETMGIIICNEINSR